MRATPTLLSTGHQGTPRLVVSHHKITCNVLTQLDLTKSINPSKQHVLNCGSGKDQILFATKQKCFSLNNNLFLHLLSLDPGLIWRHMSLCFLALRVYWINWGHIIITVIFIIILTSSSSSSSQAPVPFALEYNTISSSHLPVFSLFLVWKMFDRTKGENQLLIVLLLFLQ